MEDRKIHDLKILPEYFEAVLTGDKTFEVRINDRDYKVDDFVILNEWTNDEGYTGRKILKRISYILNGGQYGIGEIYCVFGLKSVSISCKSCIYKTYISDKKILCNKHHSTFSSDSGNCSEGFPQELL